MDVDDKWLARFQRLAEEKLPTENYEAWQQRLHDDAKRKSEAESEIPPNFMKLCRDGSLEVTEATSELRDDDRMVCLSGNPGCGKTVAAADWLWRRLPGLFVKSARLARWERYDNEAMNRLLRCPRLVIDDLGTEFQDAKGNFMAILDELIDVRHDHSRPTVMTTNLDAAAFKLRYGERIADRIREDGRFVSLSGGSMRKRP